MCALVKDAGQACSEGPISDLNRSGISYIVEEMLFRLAMRTIFHQTNRSDLILFDF